MLLPKYTNKSSCSNFLYCNPKYFLSILHDNYITLWFNIRIQKLHQPKAHQRHTKHACTEDNANVVDVDISHCESWVYDNHPPPPLRQNPLYNKVELLMALNISYSNSSVYII